MGLYDHHCGYREALEAMRDLVLIKGPESRLLWANEAFRDYYGMTEDELRDLVDGPQADPDDTMQYVQDDRTVFEQATHLDIASEQITDAAGEVANFHTVKSPILESDQVVRSVGVSRRIADSEVFTRKVSHEDAKALARPLRLLTSSFPLAIAVVDLGGRVVSTSQPWRDTFGADAVSLNDHLLTSLPQLNTLASPLAAALKHGRSDLLQTAFQTEGEGEKRVLDIRTGPWKYDDGSIGGAIILSVDVTEEANRQAELEAANERFDLVAAASSVGIWDRPQTEDDSEYWSDRFYELLGFEPGEIPAVASEFIGRIHPDDEAAVGAALHESISGGTLFDAEYRLRNKSGEYRWFRGTAKSAGGHDGRQPRIVGSVQDIDSRKRAEQNLHRINEDLEHFVHVAAHDLREPARRQILMLDLLFEQHGEQLDDEIRQQLNRIQDQSRKMLAMVSGFRSLTGIAGPTLELEKVDLTDLIEHLLIDLAIADSDEVTVSVQLNHQVRGYPTLLEALFRNLINNAHVHGLRPLRIEIGEHLDDGQRVFSVSNPSPKEADRRDATPNLFLPFVRDDPGSEGSGLGLSICRRVVERHRGEIWIEPSVDTFDVHFTLGEQL